MARELIIDGTLISDESDCYVVAEIGNNHQGSVELCKEMIAAAKYSGADAVKLQKRDNRRLFTKVMYDRPYDSENAFAPTYGAHREAVELDETAFREVTAFAREQGITLFSTPFDCSSADFLAELDPPAYKIASADLTNIPLLRHVARFGKPLIISTGSATMEDVDRAVDAVVGINRRLCIMQCTSSYPAAVEDLNLRVIETFRARFGEFVIGYSGHENGIAMPLIAYMLGARMVEKHFTTDRTLKGTDHIFSLTPDGMRRMVRDLRRSRMALGDGVKRSVEGELAPMRKMKKGVVAARDLAVGHRLEERDLLIKVVDGGLPPYRLPELIGRRLRGGLRAEEGIALDQLEDEEEGSSR